MSAGGLAGLLFVPWILDGIGRKVTLAIGASIMLVGVALQSSAQSFGMFVGARFILGFGDIIVNCAAPLLIAEIAPAQDRALLVTIQAANYQRQVFNCSLDPGILPMPSHNINQLFAANFIYV